MADILSEEELPPGKHATPETFEHIDREVNGLLQES